MDLTLLLVGILANSIGVVGIVGLGLFLLLLLTLAFAG
jgi:hypothetical protein